MKKKVKKNKKKKLGTLVHCAPNDTTIKREKMSIFGCMYILYGDYR
jgi:hypothetical protein